MDRVLQKKSFLVIFTACIAFPLLLAGVFVFMHLHHDCTGGECSVCLQVEAARNIFKSLVIISPVVLIINPENGGRALKLSTSVRVFFLNPVLMNVKCTV
jgi:hypothetical protein